VEGGERGGEGREREREERRGEDGWKGKEDYLGLLLLETVERDGKSTSRDLPNTEYFSTPYAPNTHTHTHTHTRTYRCTYCKVCERVEAFGKEEINDLCVGRVTHVNHRVF